MLINKSLILVVNYCSTSGIKETAMTDLVHVIDKTRERFDIAPKAIKFEAEKGFAIALLNNNSYLSKAATESPASLAQAVASVAAIGLSLNPAEKQAYLIARNVKAENNRWQSRVFLEPSYMGLCKLAVDSGSIKWVQAQCVYANDSFVDNGPGEKPTHQYNAFSSDRGDFVGVYCVAKTSDCDFLTTTMPADKIYSIRDRSEAYKRSKSGPWVTDFEEMAKKSVIRQAFKMWPRKDDSRMAEAVRISNENEGFEPILSSPNIQSYTADQKQYFDQLIEQSDSLGMYVFRHTLDSENVFTNLYHSFEKGSKGKYQSIVNSMIESGRECFESYIEQMTDAVNGGDESAVAELTEELGKDALSLLLDKLPSNVSIHYHELSND